MKFVSLFVALVFAPLSAWLLVMSMEHMGDASASQGFSMAAFTAFVALASGKRALRPKPAKQSKKPRDV